MREQKAVILSYHQVCDRKDDPWELAVHPNHFDNHLAWLRKNYEVVPMSELARGLTSRQLRKTVAITFDDGFRDNYTNAAPLLDWHNLPATFYVAPSAVRQEHVYWWDVLQDVIFYSEVLPARFSMTVGDAPVRFTLVTDQVLTDRLRNQVRAWNYRNAVPNERVALYLLLWYHIKPLPPAQQARAIQAIRDWAQHTGFISAPGSTMTIREMQMLGENPLFSMGAHSVHHCMLSRQKAIDQAFEVKESKRQLESWLGRTIESFAYPFGSYDPLTQSLLKEAGFRYAVSADAKAVTPQDDPFALPRIQVKNWCVYEFASKVSAMVDA